MQSHIPFGRLFNFQGARETKRADYTEHHNRRELGSRFKMMFYVIGSDNQSRVLQSAAPASKTNGVVERLSTLGVPIPFHCIQLCCADKLSTT